MVGTKIAALYVRVSTDAQREEGYSLEAQKGSLVSYSKVHGIDKYKIYEDGGYSGSNLDRPAMKQMLEDIASGKVSHCIVFKLDRLSRSQKDTLYLIEDIFNQNEVSFVSIKETIDTATPMGRAMIGILSAFAQLERENIRERTRMGMLERIKEGYWMGGGRTPFGYNYDAEQGILIPNKDAETVRKMYDLYLQGYSPQKIANITGLKYDRLVVQILKRKSNIGIIDYNGKEYVGRHEAIVDEDVFYQTQKRMKERSNKPLSQSSNLLTGLIYCGECGAKMHYQKWGNRKKICCYSQQTSKPNLIKKEDCSQEALWADDLEKIVLSRLLDFKIKEPTTGVIIENKAIEELPKQIKIQENELSRLYDLYAKDGDEMLLKKITERKSQIAVLKERLRYEEEEIARLSARDVVVDKVENLKEVWDLLTFDEKKNILNILVDKIKITGNNIEINFNF